MIGLWNRRLSVPTCISYSTEVVSEALDVNIGLEEDDCTVFDAILVGGLLNTVTVTLNACVF